MLTLTKLLVPVLIAVVLVVAVVVGMQSIQPIPQQTPSPTPAVTPTQTPTPSLSPTPTPQVLTPTPSPPASTSTLSKQEMMRDLVMNYIKTSHPETAQFMTNLAWTGGRATAQNVVGAETYIYYARGWNFTMTYPVVPQPVYTLVADYIAQDVGIPYRVIWEGTWRNQIINEKGYVFAQ
jgi:hypothetical protein